MSRRDKGKAALPNLPAAVRKLRCAVYTRKSTEEGLAQAFNTLDAQRGACEAYVASQRAEGWVLVPDRYDDGGFSGGTLERPALRRLLIDIERGLVDVVVVYKIDRLSRSLTDFAKLVDVFEAHGVTFVSVTQAFNTTTSMGRLTLNVLLSFAQFEREVIGERIRDKVAASKARGMWMGGKVPLGYDVRDRKLTVNEPKAARVRWVFELFAETGSGTRPLPPRADGRWTRATSTSCSTTAPTPGRSRTRATSTPASTRPSCLGSSGTARTPYFAKARGCEPTRTGSRRRRC
jgi:DNA invertase Pin-like site-specific DNA recombinase